jgi:hypothetical protein
MGKGGFQKIHPTKYFSIFRLVRERQTVRPDAPYQRLSPPVIPAQAGIYHFQFLNDLVLSKSALPLVVMVRAI